MERKVGYTIEGKQSFGSRMVRGKCGSLSGSLGPITGI